VANVTTVVAQDESGLLAHEAEAAAYREVLDRLLTDSGLRRRLGESGFGKVESGHDIGYAAATLKAAIEPLLPRQPGRPARLTS
jgi:hypothetical protein